MAKSFVSNKLLGFLGSSITRMQELIAMHDYQDRTVFVSGKFYFTPDRSYRASARYRASDIMRSLKHHTRAKRAWTSDHSKRMRRIEKKHPEDRSGEGTRAEHDFVRSEQNASTSTYVRI